MNDVLQSTVNLNILADANIPDVEEAFGSLGEIERENGAELDASMVRNADVILVRSVTPIGPELLEGSSVQFVGSATTGTDHVDRDYLAQNGIAFHHAPGANADSVADYVIAALVDLEEQTGRPLAGQTVGIVGCGNVGTRVAKRVSAMGARTLCNDPPRVEAGDTLEEMGDVVSLADVLEGADVVTLHVPLTTDGPYPTHHLIDREALRLVGSSTGLLNTSRGSVVDGTALLDAICEDRIGPVVLDVWEGEPTPDEALVRAVNVATPHIAGYAYDGKVRATEMLYNALCLHLEIEPTWTPDSDSAGTSQIDCRCTPPDPRLPKSAWLQNLVRQAYDLQADDARMRGILRHSPEEQGDYFRRLRADYPRRREFQCHTVPRIGVPGSLRPIVTDGLQMGWQ